MEFFEFDSSFISKTGSAVQKGASTVGNVAGTVQQSVYRTKNPSFANKVQLGVHAQSNIRR